MIPQFKLIHNASQEIDQVQRSAKQVFDHLGSAIPLINGQDGLFQDPNSGKFGAAVVFNAPGVDTIVHHRLGHPAKFFPHSQNAPCLIYVSPNNTKTNSPSSNQDPNTMLYLQMQPGWAGPLKAPVTCGIYVW